ncbi:MAG: cell division topological specificity factor MinE [bacterium]
MGILSFFKSKPKQSASVAKDRLQIIVAQQRSQTGAPDYLPMLRSELMEVLSKYTEVAMDDIQINVEHENGHDVLELNVTLPTD